MKQICQSSLLLGQNVHWPRRMPLPPPVSHVEYAPPALLRSEKDGQMDGRQAVTLRFGCR